MFFIIDKIDNEGIAMDYRIEIAVRQKWTDARAESVKRGIQNILAITGVEEIRTRDVFTISADINE